MKTARLIFNAMINLYRMNERQRNLIIHYIDRVSTHRDES